jgi:hypothetical protein
MKYRSLWAGYVARIGRAKRKVLENVRLEDTEGGRMYSADEDWQHYGILWT